MVPKSENFFIEYNAEGDERAFFGATQAEAVEKISAYDKDWFIISKMMVWNGEFYQEFSSFEEPGEKLDIEDTYLETWFERDRAHVDLRRKSNDETIVEWWDEAVAEAIEDGFLDGRNLHASAFECAQSVSLAGPLGTRKHLLLTKAIEKKLPALYATEDMELDDKVAQVKFFTPDSNWTWYGIEYDPSRRLFFGWVVGPTKEYGSFSLDELESIHGPLGLPVERDKWFDPSPMSEVASKH